MEATIHEPVAIRPDKAMSIYFALPSARSRSPQTGVISPGTSEGSASPPGHDEERAAEAVSMEREKRGRSPATKRAAPTFGTRQDVLVLVFRRDVLVPRSGSAVASPSAFPPPDV